MPVKKNKKSLSTKKRKEIREAANSIPGLLIEHVSFTNTDDQSKKSEAKINQKYMLSPEKQKEQQKKRFTVFLGVGTIVIALFSLWVFNIRSFFFDSKHTLSNEEQLIDKLKKNFDSTVGLVGSPPTLPTSTPEKNLNIETLKAAVIAGLLESSTPTTSSLPSEQLSTTTISNIMINTTTTSSVSTTTLRP